MKSKVLIAVLVIVAAITAAVWQNKSQPLMTAAGDALSSELSKALGTTVRAGTVEIGLLGSVTVNDIELYDRNEQKIATAEKLEAAFRPWRILQGNISLEAVRAITVINPVMTLEQYADGKWNVEELLDTEAGEASELDLTLRVVNGTAAVAASAGQWQLEQINGSAGLRQKSLTGLQLAFANAGADIRLTGSWNSARGALHAEADQLDLMNYQALLPTGGSLQLLGGVATAAEVTVISEGEAVRYAGEARIQDGALALDGIEVRDIQGLIAFNENELQLFNSATVYEQPLQLGGKIVTAAAEPVLDLTVHSPGFDLGAVDAGLPLQGVVAFDAVVTGLAAQPAVSGTFRLPRAQAYGYTVTDAEAEVEYTDQLLTLRQARGTVLGGQVMVRGTVVPAGLEYNLHVSGSGLDSAAADMLPGLDGAASFDLMAVGRQGLDNAVIYGTAAIDSGSYRGLPFQRLDGSFYKDGAAITIDYANLGLTKGMVTASGTVVNDRLALRIRGNDLPLNFFTALQPQLVADGTASLTGTVGGTVARPEVQADFTAVNGQLFYQPFAQAGGRVYVSGDQLTVQDLVLQNGATRHRMNGSVLLKDDFPVELRLVSQQARAENLVQLLLPGEKLTGNVDNDVQLSGPLNNITARGSIVLTEGSFRGFLVARAGGHYELHDGRTTISDFLIHSLNTQVRIDGAIDPDNRFDLDIAAQDIDISRLHLRFPYPIAGQADFTGKLRGTAASPVFTGRLTADSLVFNAQQLDQVAGDVTVDGDQIAINSFGFRQGEGQFAFSGGINVASNEIYGDVTVDNGQLAALLSVLNMPVEGVDGRLDGKIAISGSTTRPDIRLTGSLREGKLKQYPLDTIEVDIALRNNIVSVNRFFARQGQGVLAVKGTADLSGPLNLEVGGREIDAGLISNWFNSSIETKGKLNFTAQVSGTADSPGAAVSLEITGGGVANATFDSLYGLLLLEQGNIQVNQLMLSKGAYRASAYGVIPVAALTAQGRQQRALKDQMDLKVRLDEADLSIMPLLTKEVSWAVGRTQGEVTVGGTLVQPTLNGTVFVQDGIIKLAALADPIQKVGLDIQFNHDKMEVKTFEGFMGGGSYHLTGSARLDGLALSDYDFQLKLDNLGVNSKYFKGPLNGSMTLLSGARRPQLSGKMVFENATIDIPYLPEMTSDSPNIGLDVEIIAGKKVRFYNPYLYDIWAEGRVHFGGTTRRPDTSGRISATRGTVNYLRTSFKVEEASAEFTQFASFAPVIHLDAGTRLDRTRVRLAINGPVGEMEFTLSSEPAMSQQEILSLLTLRSRYFDKQSGDSDSRDSGLGRDELVALLDAGLQMRFISELESAFRKAFGLDEFRLVRGTLALDDSASSGNDGDREVYNIEIGKYLTDRLMLSYTVGVGHDETNGVAFRYDLTRRMSLTASYDEEKKQFIGLETRIKF